MPRALKRQYVQVHHNLHEYLAQAWLPDMMLAPDAPRVPNAIRDPDTDFLLSPEADSRRRLRAFLYLTRQKMWKKMEAWLLKHIPNRQIVSPASGLSMLLPAGGFAIPFEDPAPVADMNGLLDWVYLPLASAEHAVRMVWPDLARTFSITTQAIDMEDPSAREDAKIYRTFHWCEDEAAIPQDNWSVASCKMVIAAVAPWAMSPYDMTEFCKAKQFPAFSINASGRLEESPSLTRSEKLWAKLWDDCTSRRCPFFVVSVYHCWVFGVFARWNTAIVSPPIMHTERRPSVVQWLVFWFAAAMKADGAWRPPLLDKYANPDIRRPRNVATMLPFSDDPVEPRT